MLSLKCLGKELELDVNHRLIYYTAYVCGIIWHDSQIRIFRKNNVITKGGDTQGAD